MGGFMRHCCEFDAHDIWYLKDNDEYTNRTLFLGECPICNKNVIELIQRNIKTNTFISVKKVGDSALSFTKSLIPEILYSGSCVNRMKFKPKPYGWRYGVNKEKKNKKNGEIIIEQYSVDFYGNSELVRKSSEN